MAGLKYEIGADVKGFQQGVNQVTQGFTKLEQASGKAFQNVARNADRGALALNSVSQVARDLPFGFVAIQNNLPIVFDQFGALIKQSGGLFGALRTLGGALIGPAGLTFAIGAVIAAGTGLVQKYGTIDNAINKLLYSSDRLVQSQLAFAEIQKEGNKNAAEDIARLTVLNRVATDTTNTLKNRKEAANELIKVYGEYLPNLTEEAVLNDEAAEAINRAKDALIAKALAAASEAKLAEIGAKILDLRVKRNEELNKELRLAGEIERIEAENEEKGQRRIAGQPKINTQISTQVGLLSQTRDNIADINEELAQQQDLFNTVTNIAVKYAAKAGDAFIKKPTPKTKKVEVTAPIVSIKPERVELDQQALNDALVNKQFNQEVGIQIPVNIKIPESTIEQLKAIGEAAQLKTLEDRTQAITSQFNDFLAPAINTVFNSLANGQNVGQALAQSFKALAVQLVITLAKAAALAVILNAIFPGGAALGGGKVSGVGNIFKALLGGLPKFAEGGIVSRPTMGIFGEAGPEAIVPLDRLNNMIGSMGNANVQVAGEFVLRGDSLYALVQRTGQRQGRVY